MKASPIINAMNGGEWSPLLEGRTDIQGYSASLYRMQNLIPSIQGPAIRRAGTGFVRQVKDVADQTWLVPFVKSRRDAVMIEFGDLYCRFYVDRAPVVTGTTVAISGATAADPVVITATGHGYSDGQDVFITGVGGMTEINGRWFVVANSATNSFELTTIHGDDVDGTDYTAYTSGGTADIPYEIASPYSAAALAGADGELSIDVVQSGDVLYITDRARVLQPRTLSRSSATSWAFAAFAPTDGPWQTLNGTATTIYSSAATGTVTLTASTSIFTAADVGTIIRLDQEVLTSTDPWKATTAYTSGDYVRSEGKEYKAANSATSGTSIPAHTNGTVSDGGVSWEYISSGYGIATITAQSGTTATATVTTSFPQTLVSSGNATTLWRRGAWRANEYPACVAFFRERLAFGGGQSLHISKSGDFGSFAIDEYGEILAESAITAEVQSAIQIVGLAEGAQLIITTVGAEYVVDAPSNSQPFGPNNIRVSPQTSYGAREIRPVRNGEAVLFVQGSGRRLRAIQYSVEVNNFVASDQTVRAEHITLGGITQIEKCAEPYQSIWCVRADGVLLSFAFDQLQQVRGWARHVLGGTAAAVECISVIPAPDGARDDLWMIVSRTINGATRRYVEYIRPEYEVGDNQNACAYSDSGLSYSGAAADTLYGFDHLEGEALIVLGDGAVLPPVTVANGQVTLAYEVEVAQLGLSYESILATNRLDGGAGDGTAQGKTKRITDCAFRVINTLGGRAGPDADTLDDIPDLNYRDPSTPMDSATPLFTGDALLSWPGGYETAARIWYVTDGPYPATIAAIMPQVVVQESR